MATLSCETTAYILWTTSLSIVYTALLDISESGITIDNIAGYWILLFLRPGPGNEANTRHTKCNAFYKVIQTPGWPTWRKYSFIPLTLFAWLCAQVRPSVVHIVCTQCKIEMNDCRKVKTDGLHLTPGTRAHRTFSHFLVHPSLSSLSSNGFRPLLKEVFGISMFTTGSKTTLNSEQEFQKASRCTHIDRSHIYCSHACMYWLCTMYDIYTPSAYKIL